MKWNRYTNDVHSASGQGPGVGCRIPTCPKKVTHTMRRGCYPPTEATRSSGARPEHSRQKRCKYVTTQHANKLTHKNPKSNRVSKRAVHPCQGHLPLVDALLFKGPTDGRMRSLNGGVQVIVFDVTAAVGGLVVIVIGNDAPRGKRGGRVGGIFSRCSSR